MRGRSVAIFSLGLAAVVAGSVFGGPVTEADDGQYWVVGSFANGCRIVASNPVVRSFAGEFSDGPYRSKNDAKLAMSTIGVCKT